MVWSVLKLASRFGWRTCSTHTAHAAGKLHQPARQILPNSVVPNHYRVYLDPDLKKFSYQGHVEIDVDVKARTNKITLNVLDLIIKKAALNGILAAETSSNEENQQITWRFPQTLQPGSKATVRVEFDGVLNDKLSGFYRSIHKDTKGREHVVATTQMEPNDCRRAFPCFDEPALKATFNISVAAEKNMTVLSNGSITSTSDASNGKVITHFETTPKMSTYLVAVVVGELNYVESHAFRVPVRVYATPGMEQRCQYSADLAAKTLDFFEKKFGIEYPMSKCDMVGIHDFSAGAMENWGLITFRLADLFFTEGKDSVFAKCRVTEVVQHELAHQWFGNLVTMDWWDGLWLNEGFATWMSWYAGHHFNPEWKVWESYVQNTYAASLRRDSVRSSHPVEVPIVRAQEVDEIFDAISYNKGSCVIRMISQYLGEETFIKGVSLYLSRHKYGNTTTSDLWDALSEVSGKDVERFMGPWTREVGYPLLTVTEPNPRKDVNRSEIKVTQNRFLSTFDVRPEEDEVIWPISLEVRRSDGSVDHDQVLTERSATVEIDSVGTSETLKKPTFFKLNADQNGIYRVKYPDSILAEIASEGARGHESKLSVEDRIGILNDLNALLGPEIHASQLLTIIQQWKNDQSPNVLLAILNALSNISRQLFFQSEEVKSRFRDFHASVVVPLADKYGQKLDGSTTDVLETELKSTLFSACRAVRSPRYVKLALDMYSSKKFDIPSDFVDAVYVAVAEHGTRQQWKELIAHYEEGTNVMSGHAALFAAGRSHEEYLQVQVLGKILNQDIKIQDAPTAFQGVMTSTPESAELGWNWFAANWDHICAVFPATNSMLGRMVSISITTINKPDHIERVQKFFANKNLSGIERVYASSLDALTASAQTIEPVVRDVNRWLDEQSK